MLFVLLHRWFYVGPSGILSSLKPSVLEAQFTPNFLYIYWAKKGKAAQTVRRIRLLAAIAELAHLSSALA